MADSLAWFADDVLQTVIGDGDDGTSEIGAYHRFGQDMETAAYKQMPGSGGVSLSVDVHLHVALLTQHKDGHVPILHGFFAGQVANVIYYQDSFVCVSHFSLFLGSCQGLFDGLRDVSQRGLSRLQMRDWSQIATLLKKNPTKGESFSDFIAIFAMSVGFDTYFDLQL